MKNNITKIFGLSGSKKLIEKLKNSNLVKVFDLKTMIFADGEIIATPQEFVRGCDVVLIQSTSNPVNDRFMELLIAIDAIKRASAKSINVIIPYMGYSRQDRKTNPREPITFKLIANMLQSAGASRILTWDIHSPTTQGFFDIPFDSLEACWLLLDAFTSKTSIKDFAIVAPDYGSIKRARDISVELEKPLIIIDKRRPAPNTVEISNILGDCQNKNCVIIDDMIDTGGTIIESSKLLKEKGAKTVSVLATHALFNKDAISRLKNAYENNIINNIFVTDTVERDLIDFVNVVSISDVLIKASKIFNSGNSSMSSLIKEYRELLMSKIKCAVDENCVLNDKK